MDAELAALCAAAAAASACAAAAAARMAPPRLELEVRCGLKKSNGGGEPDAEPGAAECGAGGPTPSDENDDEDAPAVRADLADVPPAPARRLAALPPCATLARVAHSFLT
jgi:hypothetical protein